MPTKTKVVAKSTKTSKRKYFSKVSDTMALPDLINVQKDSFEWFIKKGLQELFDEVSPIRDYQETDFELFFTDFNFDEPKYSEKRARDKNITFECPLRVNAKLVNKKTGEIKEQEIYMGDFPVMTPRGTFIVNGVERVVVSQLIRSPGVFFSEDIVKGKKVFGAKIIPNRGAWLEIETDANGVIAVKIDRKRKVPVTALLRAFGYGSNEEIKALFKEVDTDPDLSYIDVTIAKDVSRSVGEGLKEVYKRIRPGDLATVDNAKQMIEAMFFNFDRYDFGRVGRYKINQRLGLDTPNNKETRVMQKDDLVRIIQEVIKLNINDGQGDDIDHLGNRRVRAVGELLQNKFRIGLARMERIVIDRMSTISSESVTPSQLVNSRPVISSIREFFTSSQLSQFMDQTNPLAELAHKRRLSAMGPGGLSRERAGFEVRDVHSSHYGRICPIETPEGPNIGLVGHLASFARINEYGFIETPYRKVLKEVPGNDIKLLIGKVTHKPVTDSKGKVIVPEETEITETLAKKIAAAGVEVVKIKSEVTNEIVYLDAFDEEKSVTAPATTGLDEQGHFVEENAEIMVHNEPLEAPTGKVDYMDVGPKQIISVTTALIPFVEHDDANRALMGSNMQRQAVSCVTPQAPIVGTGIEEKVARDSGQVIVAANDGKVIASDAAQVSVLTKKGDVDEYPLHCFVRSNQSTCINQRPTVNVGDKIKAGDILADGPSIEDGELALGQNVLVAFMSWHGGNYEDAVLISDRLVQEDRYSSIHIEDFSVDVRDTKLGPEVVTRDIPNVGEEKLKDLDEEGIVRVGAQVRTGDILVGKITPKGEADLTPEERLLRAIFGEKARDVKDSSLTLPHGEYGKVVDVKLFSREQGDKLPTGVIKTIQVSVAKLRKIQVGDKMAGRHGNKGVISRVIPQSDMPFLADGTPVDIILSPLGVTSRMNLGQILETHLGWAAQKLGYKAASPALDGVSEVDIRKELKRAGLPEDGKSQLYDGQTGEPMDRRTTVGIMYMLKLHHLVEDKVHQRSIGPYSLVTQQPLGGKAQFGGQRFGEMEVWALEAYGAANMLQEILTIKSDDTLGRSKTYESIVKGEQIRPPHIPASFEVLVNELKGLALDVDLIGQRNEIEESEEQDKKPELKKTEVQKESEKAARAKSLKK
jgi:DNA-directed RNA polymerase subunit beta